MLFAYGGWRVVVDPVDLGPLVIASFCSINGPHWKIPLQEDLDDVRCVKWEGSMTWNKGNHRKTAQVCALAALVKNYLFWPISQTEVNNLSRYPKKYKTSGNYKHLTANLLGTLTARCVHWFEGPCRVPCWFTRLLSRWCAHTLRFSSSLAFFWGDYFIDGLHVTLRLWPPHGSTQDFSPWVPH